MDSRPRHIRVSVRDLPVMADIGINPEEIGQRQPLVISVALSVAWRDEDSITTTVDYRRIAQAVQTLADQRIGLIESFAQRLADQCAAFPGVVRASVTVDKPRALSAGLASVTAVSVRPRTPPPAEPCERAAARIPQEVM